MAQSYFAHHRLASREDVSHWHQCRGFCPCPLELASRLVKMFSFVGDTVLDAFAGTGTTLLAAAKAQRNSIGIEIEPRYCALAEQRLEGELKTFSGTRN